MIYDILQESDRCFHGLFRDKSNGDLINDSADLRGEIHDGDFYGFAKFRDCESFGGRGFREVQNIGRTCENCIEHIERGKSVAFCNYE